MSDPKPLDLALTPFTPPKETLAEVAEAAPLTSLDLSVTDDADLLVTDTTHADRLVYVLSLVRLAKYLKTAMGDEKAVGEQARVAAAMVKHYESQAGAGALEWGRTKGDTELAAQVEETRQQLQMVVEKRVRYTATKTDNGSKAGS